jgi:hypothetical protein
VPHVFPEVLDNVIQEGSVELTLQLPEQLRFIVNGVAGLAIKFIEEGEILNGDPY